MSRPYCRQYEQELLTKLYNESIDDSTILSEILGFFNSDDTCSALESICDDYNIEYEE